VSNDLATYSEAFGHAYIAADHRLDRRRLRGMLARLQALPGRPGYVTETFRRQARYFSPDNGARVDAMRDAIDGLTGDPALRGACSRA